MTRPLRIVLIKDGEPLPQLCAPWTLRTGNLARELASRGHDVTWLSSTFMHYEKKHYSEVDLVEEIPDGYQMQLLRACGYQKNISPQRMLHHAHFGIRLLGRLRSLPLPPDVVVCCIPTIEAAAACWLYRKQTDVPLILDIRDPWPEAIVAYAPKKLQAGLRHALIPYFALASRLFRDADSLTACSHGFLDWAQSLAKRSSTAAVSDKVFYHGAHELHGQVTPDPIIPTQGLRTIYAGSLSRTYDLEPVLSLAVRLASHQAPHHFFLAGQGDRYEALVSKYNDLPNLTFTGWLPRAQVYALAQTCHLGWLPWNTGTDDFLPNKVFEYPSLGLATAVSTLGEAGRLVVKHEMGFHYQDSAELYDIASKLEPDSNPLRHWQASGREYFRKHGSAAICAHNFAKHVEIVAERLDRVST